MNKKRIIRNTLIITLLVAMLGLFTACNKSNDPLVGEYSMIYIMSGDINSEVTNAVDLKVNPDGTLEFSSAEISEWNGTGTWEAAKTEEEGLWYQVVYPENSSYTATILEDEEVPGDLLLYKDLGDDTGVTLIFAKH